MVIFIAESHVHLITSEFIPVHAAITLYFRGNQYISIDYSFKCSPGDFKEAGTLYRNWSTFIYKW